MDRFSAAVGDTRGLSSDAHATRDRAALIAALRTAATDVAVPDIIGDFDRLTLICEAHDLDLDPATLNADERALLLASWRSAIA